MKRSIYPKLAIEGMKKNRKLYIPYLLSCIGMVMMFYIVQSISYSPLLREMRGGGTTQALLSLGKFVIAVFALIFLFYTNSFLVRRRYKEFGLYNVLGMDKRGIRRIVFFEGAFTAIISLACGIALGIAFSKLAELGLLRAIKQEVDYSFTINGEAIGICVLVFGIIFALIILRSLWQVGKAKPIELMRSEKYGEKPPRLNSAIAIIGALLLAAAYYIAVSITNPLKALLLFFVAVIMVIVATYMLFITGSVALCRILQKDKKFYYKKRNFVSVSSMAFRMKRNGAGLASICILCTMVLVMIASTTSLYFGSEESMRSQYPRDNIVTVDLFTVDELKGDRCDKLRGAFESVFASHNFTPEDVSEYKYATISGCLSGDTLDPDSSGIDLSTDYDNVREVVFLLLDEYNSLTGCTYSLPEGHVLLASRNCKYQKDSLTIGGLTLNIAQRAESVPDVVTANTAAFPTLFVIVPDFDVIRPLEELRIKNDYVDYSMMQCSWFYGYNSSAGDDETIAVFDGQLSAIISEFDGHSVGYSAGSLPLVRSDYYSNYGGLFFLGIILSIVFIFAAAMIIYYKQVSEGFEDRERFDIMQKVGMTKDDIKRSIDSQVLTVFFAPLVAAGIHLSFAFPMIWRLLTLFSLSNLGFVILVTACAFVAFALLYMLLYKLTARAYYSIVSKKEN